MELNDMDVGTLFSAVATLLQPLQTTAQGNRLALQLAETARDLAAENMDSLPDNLANLAQATAETAETAERSAIFAALDTLAAFDENRLTDLFGGGSPTAAMVAATAFARFYLHGNAAAQAEVLRVCGNRDLWEAADTSD